MIGTQCAAKDYIMKTLASLLAVVLGFSAVACASAADGGEDVDGSGSALSSTAPAPAADEVIFGTLTGSNGPNAHLTLTCGAAIGQADADSHGSFRVFVKGGGRCHLQVNDMAAPGELMFVYDEPTRYDYEVTKVDGVTQISRR